jgi:Zn-finger nucleic acid-binding protein
MHCPRCQNVVMEELDRSGVTIDRCPTCRGIFLDRGELEKITARADADYGDYRPPVRHRDDDPPSSRRGQHHYKQKKPFWHELFD